jgi:7,8-dihydroneopterin aldolase/epimerase/oxygenase
MIGIIGIEKLEVSCVVGAYPHERTQEQILFIDLKIEADLSLCIASDCLQDAIDYAQLAEACRVVGKRSFYLIEAFAAAVIAYISVQFPVIWIWVKVCKPAALARAEAFVELEMLNESVLYTKQQHSIHARFV